MPRKTASPPRTTRLPSAYAPYPSRPNHASNDRYSTHDPHAQYNRPARAAAPRSLAEPLVAGDYDYDPYYAPSRSPSPFLPPPPMPSRSQQSRIARSPTPPLIRKARRKVYDRAGTQKKVPNTFMMYKNDFHRRYPEICVLERLPTQRMRIAARIWDIESDQVREFYERRYRNAMIAAGRKFAEKDMKKRRKRTLNVTSTRRARKAAQGETLTQRSQVIVQHWSYGLRRTKLIKAIHEWEETQSPGIASNNLRQSELQNMLTTLRELEDAFADDPDQKPLDDEWPLPDLNVTEEYPSPLLLARAYYPSQSISDGELPKPSVAHETSPAPIDAQSAPGTEVALRCDPTPSDFYAPPAQRVIEPASHYDPAPSNFYAPPSQSVSFYKGDYSRYASGSGDYYGPSAQSAVDLEEDSAGAVFHATGGKYHHIGDSSFQVSGLAIPHSSPVPEMAVFTHTSSPIDAACVVEDARFNAPGYYYGLSEIVPAMPLADQTCYQLDDDAPVVASDPATGESLALDPALIIRLDPTPPPVAQTSPRPASPDGISYDLIASPGLSVAIPSFMTAQEPREPSPGIGLKPLSDNPWFGAPSDDYSASQLDPSLLDYPYLQGS